MLLHPVAGPHAATSGAESAPAWLALGLLVLGAVYLRGFARLWRAGHPRLALPRALAFAAGVAALLAALVSPLDALADRLLLAHMGQHVLLMMVAPPLLWLGLPLAPLLRGLPRVLERPVARLLSRRPVRRLGLFAGHPVTAWLAFVATTWLWHTPALYELALRSEAWHAVEHACFVLAALLFWWPVIQPWPSHPRWPRWAMLPYLALADLQNTALSALLTFSGRVLYPSYAALPRPFELSPLQDQAAAGVLMWVPGSLAFLLPLGWIVAELLAPRRAGARARASTVRAAPGAA